MIARIQMRFTVDLLTELNLIKLVARLNQADNVASASSMSNRFVDSSRVNFVQPRVDEMNPGLIDDCFG